MRKVLILTVGGSHEPIVKSIKDTKADYVVFLCSDDLSTTKGSYTQITDKIEIKSKDGSNKSFSAEYSHTDKSKGGCMGNKENNIL